MDTNKIDIAIAKTHEALKGLDPSERLVVLYTVGREQGKPGRKRGVKQQLELGATDAS